MAVPNSKGMEKPNSRKKRTRTAPWPPQITTINIHKLTDLDLGFICKLICFCWLLWKGRDCEPPGKSLPFHQIRSDQSLSHVLLFATPWITACQAALSINNSQSSHRLTSIESVMPSSHLILCHPLLLLPPIPPSIRVFSKESTLCMRWSKYWSFSFSIIPSKEIPGLMSFRMDWLDLLAVQGTLKSLL